MSFPSEIAELIRRSSTLSILPQEREALVAMDGEPWKVIDSYLRTGEKPDVPDAIKDLVGKCVNEVKLAIQNTGLRKLAQEATHAIFPESVENVKDIFSLMYAQTNVMNHEITSRFQELTRILENNFTHVVS